MPKDRLDRWRMDTSDLIDECEEAELARDEARRAAYRIIARFAPRYEIDRWGKEYPWLHDLDAADAGQRASADGPPPPPVI